MRIVKNMTTQGIMHNPVIEGNEMGMAGKDVRGCDKEALLKRGEGCLLRYHT